MRSVGWKGKRRGAAGSGGMSMPPMSPKRTPLAQFVGSPSAPQGRSRPGLPAAPCTGARGVFWLHTLGELLRQTEGFEGVLSHRRRRLDRDREWQRWGQGTGGGLERRELLSPSPVLQLLPFNAQRPGPERGQLGRGILSFPSLLLLLLNRQAVGKPREAAFRPGEGERKGVNVTEAPRLPAAGPRHRAR